MSWNECLYWYARERGGTYFGMWPSGVFDPDSDGALLLEDPKGPVLVCAQVTYSGQYGTHRDAIVRTRAELERPYTLRVKKQSSLREGVNTVLDGLGRGARIFGKKTDLSPDYGAPELADGRGIKTSEPEFTRWVLQSRELKELLTAWPDFRLQVGPTGPVGGAHLVEARVTLEQDEMADTLLDQFGTEQDGRANYQASGFQEQLDALVELAKAARDAVTTWPMPMKMP